MQNILFENVMAFHLNTCSTYARTEAVGSVDADCEQLQDQTQPHAKSRECVLLFGRSVMDFGARIMVAAG